MDYSAQLQKFANGSATEEEKREFNNWLDTLPKDEYRRVLDEYEALLLKQNVKEEYQQEWLDQLLKKIKETEAKPKVVPMRRTWIKWVAAASIILVLGVGGYLFFVNKKPGDKGTETTVAKTNDVPAPNSTKAMITLADGTKVYLDSVGNGVLAQQSGVSVMKSENGQIVYSHEDTKTQSELVYNTLTNPRGSKVINMTLSDGSHVWLNAGSSVTYPVAFVGNERKVEITGEAYFEVTHDASKPFVVSKGETSVTVLGTHFNVNAYDDEESLKVTLIEGSVKVSVANKSVTIKPGEQAQMNGGNAIGLVVNRGVDVDEVMAWKNGLFQFGEKVDIQTIMRQIARWYDVDVEYKGNITQHFGGSISRGVNLSQVLKVMEATGGVKFKVEGRQVIVMP